MKKIILYLLPFLILSTTGCKKDYLETEPSNGVSEELLFSNFGAVTAALNGIYKEQFASGIGGSTGHDNFGQKSFDLQMDLMGNDMIVHSQGYGWMNTDYSLTAWQNASTGQQSDNAWFRYYDIIKQANALINNVQGLQASQDQKDALQGQAYGLRAYAYYYLANLFQQTYKGNESKPGVPIYTMDTIVGKGRGTLEDDYKLILADLDKAETLLTGKARADKSVIDVKVVQGFKARVALLMHDWVAAASNAKKARTGYSLMKREDYTQRTAFSSVANPESMWGSIIPEEQATIYASFWSHIDIGTGGYAALGGQKKITKALYDQMNDADIRKAVFTAPGTGTTTNPDYNSMKFQTPVKGKWAGDYQYMRVSEMYLIEAEGLARQTGKDAEAIAVLEELVKARFPGYSAAGLSGNDLINEILLQRRIELWGQGFALIDIKRLNQGLDRPQGPGNHGAPNFNPGIYNTSPADPKFIMRIPQRELDNNINMTPADQNP